MIEVELAKQLLTGTGSMALKVKLTIQSGSISALYGDSGSGKTSIVRMIAGLMKPDDGLIAVDNSAWFDQKKHINLRPQERHVGIVFQDPSLFPHMTVRENISYALQPGDSPNSIDHILELMELSSFSNMKPHLLSGGQKQRVALARAITRKPQILLLDEPTSAMDSGLRFKMQDYILAVHQQFKMTILLVSHDIVEVARLAGEVLMINNGLITTRGKPKDVLPVQDLKDILSAL